jgi:hypothetical protein
MNTWLININIIKQMSEWIRTCRNKEWIHDQLILI